MSIELLHISDIHLGSGEIHGVPNPSTGLNTRFEDFAAALTRAVDYAIDNNLHAFLFTGDAYKNATPEPLYQKAFASQLKRLSDAGVSTVLVVGNHDLLLKSTGSHSMSVFETLAVPNVIVVDRPQLHTLATPGGTLQLVGLPYVTRHWLMTNESYGSLAAAALDRVMTRHLQTLLQSLYDRLDPSQPAVAAAHIMLDRARAGAEQELMVGYSQAFPLELFVDERLDYVALGHVHRHQVLRAQSPAVVYAGSIERVDFSEEEEDKGFLHVSLAKENTRFRFVSSLPRPFVTVDADLTGCPNAGAALAEAVAGKIVPNCVLRVRYRLTREQAATLDESLVRKAAAGAMSLKLRPEVAVPDRPPRMPELDEGAVKKPLAALEQYLNLREPQDTVRLMERARYLLNKLSESTSPSD